MWGIDQTSATTIHAVKQVGGFPGGQVGYQIMISYDTGMLVSAWYRLCGL